MLERDGDTTVNITSTGSGNITGTLDILVQAVGRDNSGSQWDFKGLQSGNVTLDGASA